MCVGSIDSCALDRSLASGRAFVNCKCRNTHSRCIALLRRSVSQCSNDIGREACPGFCLESVATCESKNSFRHGQTAGRRLVTRQSSAQQAWVCTCVYRVSTSGCRRHVVRVVESGQPAVCVCVSIYIYIYIYIMLKYMTMYTLSRWFNRRRSVARSILSPRRIGFLVCRALCFPHVSDEGFRQTVPNFRKAKSRHHYWPIPKAAGGFAKRFGAHRVVRMPSTIVGVW